MPSFSAPHQPSFSPPTHLSGFQGHPTTLQEMVRAAQGPRGEQSMFVRSVAEQIIAKLQPKDYLSEILAIIYWVTEHVHYVSDQLHVEMVKDPQRHLEEIAANGQSIGDCDDIACLIATLCMVIGRVAEFVVVGFGEAGHYSHVFARVEEPRSEQWIVGDPVAGTDPRGMLDRVTTFYTVSCDELPSAVRNIT